MKFLGFRWEAVDLREYTAAGTHFKDVTRQSLLGDAAGEGDLNFITRYFEIQPGGYSTLERHQHPHVVVVLRGRGRVLLGDKSYEIGPYDCVYVSPKVYHQFQATGDEPLGFLCTVERIRDRPELPSEEDLKKLTTR
ncbi:MAG: cupin domain-containing protein [Elusimicrobia bacterium]|nr:cupin domain-containing protein [Elusimicrobiota bacterium]